MTRGLRIAVALAASVAVVAGAVAAAPPKVSVHRLDVGAWIFGTWCIDVDGDGRRDVILQTANTDGRRLHVFRQTTAGFAERPDVAIDVPKSASYFSCGAFAEDGGFAILFFGHNATLRCRLAPHGAGGSAEADGPGYRVEPMPGGDLPLLPRLAPSGHCYAWRRLADFDGDGRTDVILPTADGYRVLYQRTPGRFTAGPSIARAVESESARRPGMALRVRRSIPVASITDLDGDGRPDAAVVADGRLLGYGGTDAGLSTTPFIDAPLRFLRTLDEDDVGMSRLHFADVNGDRIADLVYMRKTGRVGLFKSMRTRVALFIGPFHTKTKPDQILNIAGLSKRPRIVDFDGDGDLDLLLSTLELNAFSAIRMVVDDTVPATFSLFRFDRETQRFAKHATRVHEKRVPFDSLFSYGPVPLAFLHGDFDGDGVNDLFDAANDRDVSVRRGRGEGRFDDAPLFRAKIAYTENVWFADLSGEGKTDVLCHRGTEATVLLCR